MSTGTPITVAHHVTGEGDLVLFVMGTGSPGRVWSLHQTPAFTAAGYQVGTFDNRGQDGPAPGLVIDDLVADAAALIETWGAPAHVVGTSLGARVVQELALARPELVRRAVAMTAHARLGLVHRRLTLGEMALHDGNVVLPPSYYAAVTAQLNLSPATLRDEAAMRDWLDMFELGGSAIGAGVRAQLALSAELGDRTEAYRAITTPMLVVAFADDRMVPPYLSREVADAVPGASYREIPDTGHFGYLERPDAVNSVVLDFLADR